MDVLAIGFPNTEMGLGSLHEGLIGQIAWTSANAQILWRIPGFLHSRLFGQIMTSVRF